MNLRVDSISKQAWPWILVLFICFCGILGKAQQTSVPFPDGAIARLGLRAVYDIAYSPDGELIAVATRIAVELRDTETLEVVHLLTGHSGVVYSLAFSPDGKILASGSRDDTVKLWDVTTGQVRYALSGHTYDVESVAFSPDGKTLVSGSGDRTIKFWDVARGREKRTLTGHTGTVYSVAFSPDGKTLVSGSGDRTIKFWDVATGREKLTFSGHGDIVESVSFSRDGETVASGSADGTIKLWDVSKRRERCTLTGHTSTVYSVAFSPDGKTLASGSGGGTIKLWDVATGTEKRTLTGHTRSVNSVAFSTDAHRLASSSDDGTVLLWDVSKILHPQQPPTATFIWDSVSSTGAKLLVKPRVGDRVQFDASSSGDPDRQIAKYAWDWNNDGQWDEVVSYPVAGHSFSSPGTYQVTLRVTDDDGATGKTTRTVEVVENKPPTASFTFSPSDPRILDTLYFTHTSSDLDGQIMSWEWEFGDGNASTERNPAHFYEQPGTYTVTLTVTDNDGLTDQTTQSVIVEHKDLIQANFTFSLVDQEMYMVELDASEAISTMGEIIRYEWDWDGDGTYDTAVFAPQMTHRFEGEAPYKVILTIVDSQGNRASCTKHVAP